MTYGTLVVDLRSRRPIELLPDRSAETAEVWLRAHPEILLVSRDRGGDYAAAAKRGAPQAEQVSDKFHLLKNLRERIKELLDRRHSCLPIIVETRGDAVPSRAQGMKALPAEELPSPSVEGADEKHSRTIPPTPYWRPPPDNSRQLQRQGRRERRSGLYEEVRRLHRASGWYSRHCSTVESLSKGAFVVFSRLKNILRWHRTEEDQGGVCWMSTNLTFGSVGSRDVETAFSSMMRSKLVALLDQHLCSEIFAACVRKQHKAARSAEVLSQTSSPPIETSDESPPKPQVKRRLSPTRARLSPCQSIRKTG